MTVDVFREMETDESPLRKLISDYICHRNVMVHAYHYRRNNGGITQLGFAHALAAYGPRMKDLCGELDINTRRALFDAALLHDGEEIWTAFLELFCIASYHVHTR